MAEDNPTEDPAGLRHMDNAESSRSGDLHGTVNQLLPMLYEELRRLANAKLAHEPSGHTLQPTALVNEVYLRLAQSRQTWGNRGEFMAAAAEAMRRILIDNARRRLSLKRGGQLKREVLPDFPMPNHSDMSIEDLLSLNEALEKLETHDPKVAELVKLRFFAGMTAKQAGEVIGISHNTIDSYWAYAKGWLRLEMGRDLPGHEDKVSE